MVDWEDKGQASTGTSTQALSALEADEQRRARDVMQYGVFTANEQDSVYQAIGTMVQKKVSGLPVVDNETIVGMITEKDVLRLLYNTEFLPGLVKDYMTANVVCFDIEENLVPITRCLIESGFRRVPICYGDRLAGVISRADLIRANRDRFRPEDGAEPRPSRRKEELRARDAMTITIPSVAPQTPVLEAADLLARTGVPGLPVVDEAMNLEGIITEKDFLSALYDANCDSVAVEDLMTRNVIAFEQDDSLFEICESLIQNDFRRVPILRNGKLVGILSRADLMVYIMKNKSAVFRRRASDLSSRGE